MKANCYRHYEKQEKHIFMRDYFTDHKGWYIKMDTELLTSAMHVGKIVITSPAVQGIVSTLITTLFVRRGENIKFLNAIKEKEFAKITNELLNSGRLSYIELYKCRNFLKIAERADEVIADYQEHNLETEQEPDTNNGENIFDFDWLMRFFDAVGNITSEELQQLWGKVLANEISSPKSCTLRTLDMVRNMTPEEAKTFSLLCRYVMRSGNTYYIDAAGFFCEEDNHIECRKYVKSLGMTYEEHIVPLLEAGALSTDHSLAAYVYNDNNLEFHNDKLYGIIMNVDEKPALFQREAYFLSTSGKELFQIIHKDSGYIADEEYTLLCLKEMKEQYPAFYVGAYSISEKGVPTDLLEND